MLYPSLCMSCSIPVDDDPALCSDCWGQAHFLSGLCCDACGVPLPGAGDGIEHCDLCLERPPPWARGRAVALYEGPIRKMVLSLKHGDRQDIARSVVPWMAAKALQLQNSDTLVVPVPLHWTRLIRRRYNQAALLAQHLGPAIGCPVEPDLLLRHRQTAPQERMSMSERFGNQANAISVKTAKSQQIHNRPVLLVDDVMTSGATLTACANVCLDAGASQVDVLVLARVAWPD